MTIQFQVGSIYEMSSPCDHNAKWQYRVIKRTAKFVTVEDLTTHETTRKKVQVWYDDSTEYIHPMDEYSMSPYLQAKREVKEEVTGQDLLNDYLHNGRLDASNKVLNHPEAKQESSYEVVTTSFQGRIEHFYEQTEEELEEEEIIARLRKSLVTPFLTNDIIYHSELLSKVTITKLEDVCIDFQKYWRKALKDLLDRRILASWTDDNNEIYYELRF